MVAKFLDLNKLWYEFPVLGCTQEQNGSPYVSSVVREYKLQSRSRNVVEIQKFWYRTTKLEKRLFFWQAALSLCLPRATSCLSQFRILFEDDLTGLLPTEQVNQKSLLLKDGAFFEPCSKVTSHFPSLFGTRKNQADVITIITCNSTN